MGQAVSQVDSILQIARQQDPSIEPKAGAEILRVCLDELARDPDATASDIARRCVAREPTADASWVSHLARAAVTTLAR
jgi:cobalamin-dependent methionine synthase I